MKALPEIRINYSWLLQSDVSEKICKLNDWELPSDEQCLEWAENYRKAWVEKESDILSAMQEFTGLEFYKNVIDVSLAANIIPKSDPLIISFRSSADEFVDLLTHELIHVLLTDNKILTLQGQERNFELLTEWKSMFAGESDFTTLVHIPVYAIQKKIMLEIQKQPSRVLRDREFMSKIGADSYVKSWDYIEANGHEVIINKLKKSYTEIAEKMEKKL